VVGALVVGVSALDRSPVDAELVAAPAVPAFPGAEGFGTQTPGGRGGAILKVTNLNDSGAGSLRAALTASGARTVVFRVSGTIVLKSRIDVEDPYLTVAGQTAPGGGITLRLDPAASPCIDQGTMLISTHDVIIRYLRLRPGPTPCADDSEDALTIYKPGTENVVIDHVSLSWAVDEVLNTYDASQNITISNSIIAEGLSNSTHQQGEHSKGALLGGVGAHNVSMHGNLFVSNMDRNPQISGLSVADVRNNVIYNYGDGSGSGVTLISSSKGEPRVNWVGNYYKPGPSSDRNRPEFAVYSGDTGDTWQWYGDANMRWTPTGLATARVDSGATASRVLSPFPATPVTTTSAAAAYEQVLAHAGAAVPVRDAVDQRLVQSVVDGTGQLVDDPSQVGGYPSLPSTAPAPDNDADGMPNSVEVANGTNPSAPDSNGDVNGNGYTNIEDWFNSLAPSPSGQTSATALALKGDKATATVTANGAAPTGTVTFSVGGKAKTKAVVSGKATAKLPSVPPGHYIVSAEFVPSQPSLLTTSTDTASYTVPRIATKSRAFASYVAPGLLKARARVAAHGGSDVSGKVKIILKRNGQTIKKATVRLSSLGVAKRKFRGTSPSGKYLVVAKYLGTRKFKPSTDRFRFTLP
jgi:pectate lyase